MKIYYGIEKFYIDITEKVNQLCYHKDKEEIIIPKTDDERAQLFGDPIYGSVKHILIVIDNENENQSKSKEIIQRYDESIIRLKKFIF